MSSNNYQIYINKTLQLAETIVIKSSYTAKALNDWVFGSSGYTIPVGPDPTTWKYYRNLAGEYHSIDKVMTVVSMDTLETIEFTKANLLIHLATARAYQYGTRKYTELVAAYPDQEQLILGILYPADIQFAIKAKDGQILSYPPGLVEENEYTLIEKLQTWIDHYKQRWYIPGFDYVDELYGATMLGQMHLLLFQCILTKRKAACNTNEAHSFWVRQYLGSHGYLDAYVDAMTTKQALFFYRNIAYIERHAGRNETFDTLLEHIMTERFIPLAEYSMKHDVTDQIENLYPEVIFRQRQLNLGIALAKDNKTSIAELLVKEKPLALSNGVDLEDVGLQVRELMENSPSNVVATKALQSTMIDDTNSSPWILSEALFNHWLYLSSLDLYVAYVNIVNPKSGERIPLTAKEAFILSMYVYGKTLGVTFDTIPLAYASRVQRIPNVAIGAPVSVDDIYSIVDHALIERSVAVQALSQQPRITKLLSIDAFYNLSSAINDAVQMQRRLIAVQQHYERRGMVQAMVTRIYSDHILELEPQGTSYASWLSARNIDLSALNHDDFDLLYKSIVEQATGASLHTQLTIRELQQSMANMFTQLSSYGIQIIAEINDANIRKTDWPGVRPGDVVGELFSNPQNPDATVSAQDVTQALAASIEVELNHPAVNPDVRQYGRHRVSYDTNLRGDCTHEPTVYNIDIQLPHVVLTSPDPKVPIPRGWVPFIGIEYFLNLDPGQVIIIDPTIPVTPTKKIPLPQVVVIQELLLFDLGDQSEPLSTSITDTLLGKTFPEN